jgi:YidC/Oxa1 family membrane protein insertase
MNNKFLNYALLFLMIFLLGQAFLSPAQQPTETPETPITFQTTKNSYKQGKVVELKVKNHTEESIKINLTGCPAEPFSVYRVDSNKNQNITATPEIPCEAIDNPHKESVSISANSSTTVRYNYWSNQLFDDLGRYKISSNITLGDENFTVNSNEFEIKKSGFIWRTWNEVLYRPIYNGLIFLINILPGKSLGLAIILLTIAIRGVLYGQNKKALTAQKKMSEIQPKLNKLKEKYKDNQQKLAEETMKIWQEHKVNPMSGCLPILIQFPILIALFFVVQDGLNPDQAVFLYEPLKTFDFQAVSTNFLGLLELTKQNLYVLPLLVGGLQFAQLYMTTQKNKKQEKEKKKEKNQEQMQTVQNTMLYFMPVMIAVITASLPAGVGLYWGTSTLFAIMQQVIINKENNTK